MRVLEPKSFDGIFALGPGKPTETELEEPPQKTAPTEYSAPWYSEKQLFKNILTDQGAMWTGPLHARRRDVIWLGPIAAAAVVMRATDKRAARELGSSNTILGISEDVSRFGSGYATFGGSAFLYAVGKLSHNDRAQETGLLGAEALADTNIIVSALKLATNRQRPDHLIRKSRLLGRGESFPSGHAAMSWAFATVVANEYPNPLVRIGAYSFASVVSLSRFTGQKHYPSDIIVGSTIGFLVGRYVFKHHSRVHDVQP